MYKIIKTFKKTDSLKVKKVTGRKKLTSDKDERILIRNYLVELKSKKSTLLQQEWRSVMSKMAK